MKTSRASGPSPSETCAPGLTTEGMAREITTERLGRRLTIIGALHGSRDAAQRIQDVFDGIRAPKRTLLLVEGAELAGADLPTEVARAKKIAARR